MVDHAARDRGTTFQGGQGGQPALDIRGQRHQLRRRRDVEAAIETAHDLASLDVPEFVEGLGMKPFQQHGGACRVGPQQAYGAVAGPMLEGEMLML